MVFVSPQKMGKRMSIIRVSHDKERPYVILNKVCLEDSRITWAAKGIWSYLMSRPDDWRVSVAHLRNQFGMNGIRGQQRDSLLSYLGELIHFGYAERIEIRERGRVIEYNFIVYEHPSAPRQELPEGSEPKPIKYRGDFSPREKGSETSQPEAGLGNHKVSEDKTPEGSEPFPVKPGPVSPASASAYLLSNENTLIKELTNSDQSVSSLVNLEKESLLKEFGIPASKISQFLKDFPSMGVDSFEKAIAYVKQMNPRDKVKYLYAAIRDGFQGEAKEDSESNRKWAQHLESNSRNPDPVTRFEALSKGVEFSRIAAGGSSKVITVPYDQYGFKQLVQEHYKQFGIIWTKTNQNMSGG